MPHLHRLCRDLDRIVTVLTAAAAGLILFAMSVLVTWLVIARYAFNAPVSWGEEMARLMMFYLVLIGSAVAMRQNQHPRLTLLLDRLPLAARNVVEVLIDTAVIGTLLVLLFHGADLAREEAIMKTSALRLSYFWVYLAYPLGAGLAILQLLGRRFGARQSPFSTDEMDLVQ